MAGLRRFLRSGAVTAVLFVLAAGLLLTGTIGGTRAALTYFSEDYTSWVELFDIGVTLNENGKGISHRDYNSASADGTWDEVVGTLFSNLLPEGEELHLGQTYNEILTVTNSGTIDEYVRVSIYKYWLDAEGGKLRQLSPELIDLHLVTGSGWTLDTASSTRERQVLYYDSVLSSGATSSPFADTITISGDVARTVTRTTTKDAATGYTTIVTEYDYDGVRFQVEVEVDAVQTHNAEAAIHSAWGRRVSASGGQLRLAD